MALELRSRGEKFVWAMDRAMKVASDWYPVRELDPLSDSAVKETEGGTVASKWDVARTGRSDPDELAG